MSLWPLDRDYTGPIYEIGNADGHYCYLYYRGTDEFTARCSCDSVWSYAAGATMEHMQSIYASHLKYFNRPKMETL